MFTQALAVSILKDMRTITTLVFLIFISCGEQKTVENKGFIELRDKLPIISTPITFNSDDDINLKSIELVDNELLKGLKQRNYFSAFGKIFETENFITIIGYIPSDSGTPILVTIDKDGIEVSSHAIYETVMGDMGRYTSNFVTIDSKRIIHFTDSTLTRQINEEGDDEIPGTDALTVTIRKYRITDVGKIENIE